MNQKAAKPNNAFLETGGGADKELYEETGEVIEFPKGRVSGGQAAPYDIDADITGEINDAVVLGPEPEGFGEFLARPATFLIGKMYGAKDRRNTQDGDWEAVTMPWMAWIEGGEGTRTTPTWGFSRHPVHKIKEGASIVLGSSIEGARKANAMDEMFALGLDIDSGANLDDVVATIRRKNLFALIYTSHSHGKTGLEIKRDDVLRKLGIKEDPTLAQVQEYLRAHSKSRYEESFIEAVTIADPKKQTSKGVMVALDTPPLDKFRIIFPLDTPVKLIDLAATQQEALEVWEDKITGMAQKELGIHFDSSCTDPSRLFYTARHADDSEWDCLILRGGPLRFEDVPTMKKADYTRKRDVAGAGRKVNQWGNPLYETPSGKSLNDWHFGKGGAKDRFMIADLLEDMVPDKIRHAGNEGQGHVHVECPFENEHTEEGGTGCDARNAIDSTSEFWVWGCKHDSCQGRHKLEFLEEALRQRWFDEDLLFDEDSLYLLEPGEEVSGTAGQQDSQVPASAGTLEERCAAFDDESKAADIEGFLKEVFLEGIDVTDRARITDVLVKKTVLGKRDLNKMWSELDRVQRKIEADKAKASGEASDKMLLDSDFDRQVEYAGRRIMDANQKEAFLFNYNTVLSEIPRGSKSPKINQVGIDRYKFHVNENAKFFKRKGEDGFQHVSAPHDVASHLFNNDVDIYPELRGVSATPFYDRRGRMVTKPGFDAESGIYLNTDLVLDVPEVPTIEDVGAAKALLADEVLGDFPFGGRKRSEVVAAIKGGTAIPEVAHAFAMILLPFVREMIVGPTPIHLVNKPAAGTGGSFFVKIATMIPCGDSATEYAMPPNKNELGKTLTAILMEGRVHAVFDNINHTVDSPELASATTAGKYGARILGISGTVDVPVRVVWVFTGNNIDMTGEIRRRCVLIDMDSDEVDPTARDGWRHADLEGWVASNREEVVRACLILCQHWIAEGAKSGAKTLKSYVNWSNVMGGILDAAGIGGFLDNDGKLRAMGTDVHDEKQILMQALAEEAHGMKDCKGVAVSSNKGRFTGYVSVFDTLNKCGGDDDEPLPINGWGYDRESGAYVTHKTTSIGKHFAKLVKKPWSVLIEGVPYEMRLTKGADTPGGSTGYDVELRPVKQKVSE